MDAPEKIYVEPNLDSIWGMAGRSCESEIEYTRTDAFIEKACAWLEDNYPYYFETSIKEDFKKYMKGE